MSLKRPWQLDGKTVVLVSGSRGIRAYWQFAKLFSEYLLPYEKEKVIILQGEAYYGVDRLARIFAKRNGWRCVGWPANWDLHQRRAGHIRNAAMLTHTDCLFAVWDGVSPGTSGAITVATTKGLPVSKNILTKAEDADDRNIRSMVKYRKLGDRAVSKIQIRE